jgi:hypothetical protein
MGRAIVDQVRQLGKETTAGTQVAANKSLPALSINLSPQFEKNNFRGAGYKSTTVSAVNSLMASGGYEGPLDYNALTWVLEGLVGVSTPSTPVGGTLSRQWAFAPASAGSDSNAKTYTVEAGDSAAARVYTRLRFRSLLIEVARRAGARVSGSCYANFPTDGQSLTASPTAIAQVPVSALDWDIYMDTTFGAIGTTKLANAYSARFSVGDKFNPFYRLNSADAGAIGDEAEVAHDITGAVSIMHDATSRSKFATIVNNPTNYLRFLSQGAFIEGSIHFRLALDFAAQFENPDDDDNDGIYGITYGLRSIYDASLGGHWRATLVNTITST